MTPIKDRNLFFVLDTSGSMAGRPANTMCAAMDRIIGDLAQLNRDSCDVRVKIAVLNYDFSAKWMDLGGTIQQYAEDVQWPWQSLPARGLTNLGAALKELNRKLSRHEMMACKAGCTVPVIFFVSDGCPTDSWTEALEELKKNKWFSAAVKIAFALGNCADCDVLAEVAGNPRAVAVVHDLEEFGSIFHHMAFAAAEVCSGMEVTGAEIVSRVMGSQSPENGSGDSGFDDSDFDDWL